MTKEQEFKHRFVTVLQDLHQDGGKNIGTMALLGSLAADLSRDLKSTNWTQAKTTLTPATYDALLAKLQQEGNALHAEGKVEHAYVIQTLAMSLVAITQRADPDIVSGEKLLDHLIDSAIVLYRRQSKPS